MRLACDGPFNGQYIDGPTAVAAGYISALWPTNEVVWMQPNIIGVPFSGVTQ